MNRPIECRVVAVPGQPELAARRSLILSTANAVLFVADSRPEAFPDTIRHFQDLRSRLANRNRRIPILVQLNKRDEKPTLPAEHMIAELGTESVWRSREPVATRGLGIRESFVLVVGDALRSLAADGTIYRRVTSHCETQELAIPDPRRLLELMASPAM